MNRSDDWLDDLRRQTGAWNLPPDAARRAARQLPGDGPAPVLEDSRFSDRPLDVRGASTTVDGAGQIVTAVGSQGECSVSIQVTGHTLTLEGRVWLEDDTDAPIFLYLRHDDHVLAERRVADGETFRLTETAPAGWQLDVALPAGECLRVVDPR